MRIRIQKRGLVPAAVVAVVGTVVLYLGATAGLAAWHRQQQDAAPPTGRGYLPGVIENAPSSLPTTGEYGPPGQVAAVYAGTDVDDGLRGSVDHPWITMSATTGDYRALSEPGLPEAGPGVVQVSPDGGLIAWSGPDGLTVYDTATGDVDRPDVGPVDAVGPFADDAEHLVVHAAGAKVVDLARGEVVAEAEADAESVRGAAWRPDGTSLDLVTSTGHLVLGVDGTSETSPTSIPPGSQLAWAPQGDRLVDLHDVDGTFRLFVSDLRDDGAFGPERRVDTTGVALLHLFGFSGADTVAIDSYLLETGNIERVLDVPLGQGSTQDLTRLPSPGDNWVDVSTLSIATDLLPVGSYEWDSQVWPWSYTSRLAACAIFMFFLFGLYVTRRPKKR
ncbi:hypothetical protein GCM10009623_34700 [Nocardioides aestuarii]|uniref:WD40 repeat domain-containing protein n=1 Tax=Nocardioides aestuarii TaxID=252231 RepID=A0ABW4TS85_9ACTN